MMSVDEEIVNSDDDTRVKFFIDWKTKVKSVTVEEGIDDGKF